MMRTIEQSATTEFPRVCTVVALDERDPNAGNTCHLYEVQHPEHGTIARVQFQHGPRFADGSIPGAFTSHLIDILVDHFEGFQSGPFACVENAMVLQHLRTIAAIQDHRAQRRAVRGVLGTNQK